MGEFVCVHVDKQQPKHMHKNTYKANKLITTYYVQVCVYMHTQIHMVTVLVFVYQNTSSCVYTRVGIQSHFYKWKLSLEIHTCRKGAKWKVFKILRF